MLITFKCPHCESELEIDAAETGTRFDCPACSQEIRTPVPRVEPGTTLGNFAIQSKIGSGGMGDVFLARQISMDRLVALKVLPQALTRKPNVVERFRHEVRMSARLEHPHVVTAFEAGEDFGYHYLAMSFVDGEDLRSRLRRAGVLPEKEALTYARHIADALGYAWNTYRMLHRDVKPGNIMVDRKGKAKIMDLGISKCLAEGEDAELTVSGMLVGTPHYMSPEQALSGAELDCRADIYSLGATLYHLLADTPPYPGKTTTEVLRQIGLAPVRPLRELNSAISEPCARLVQKMMAPNREQRQPSWEAVITDIDRVLAGRDPLLAVGEASSEAPAATRPASVTALPPGPRVPPVREPPVVTGKRPGSADSAEFRTPPRMDMAEMRQRRTRWLVRQAVLRGSIAVAVLALVTAAFLVGRHYLNALDLRRRAAIILDRRAPAPRPAPTGEVPSGTTPEVPAPAVPPPSAPPGPAPTTVPATPAPAPAPSPAVAPPVAVVAPVVPAPPAEPATVPAEPANRPPPALDEAGERRLADVVRQATDHLLAGRPESAAEAMDRAAREPVLAPVSSELYRAATLAAEGGREAALVRQSLTDDLGLQVTLKTRAEAIRLKLMKLEEGAIVGVRLHPVGDTPLGQIRIPIADLSADEVLGRLRRLEGKPVGDLVLTLALFREGRAAEALEPIGRLPLLLQAPLRARAQALSRPPDPAPAKPAP